jgi:hypothetical protein
MVVFNTTVHAGNFDHIPHLVRFFIEHSADIGLVSFQLQAATGRGEWRQRDTLITQQTMKQKLEQGMGSQLPWGIIDFGHSDCHSYMPTMVINNRVFPVIDDKALFGQFLNDFQAIRTDRHAKKYQIILDYAWAILKRPKWWWLVSRYLLKQLKRVGKHLLMGKGQVNKLSFFMQNFMDAESLDQERVNACSFMVMTADGPISMCEHNARRDEFILKPLEVEQKDGGTVHYVPIPEIPKYRKAIGGN